MPHRNTVDTEELERFSRMAEDWWDMHGKFKPLHDLNPVRIGWIVDRIQDSGFRIQEEKSLLSSNPDSRTTNHEKPLSGFSLLDIGCGGGLVCEPMAKLGARVTGIDALDKNISVAKLHAQESGLNIDYRCTTAEALLESLVISHESKDQRPMTHDLFDVVLALEIIEHVADVPLFVKSVCALAKPGGMVIFSTINRTMKSFALAIVGAEYVLRWVPRGTHTWNKFLKPSELCAQLRANHIEVSGMTGMVMNPLDFKWRLDAKDLDVNYLVCARQSVFSNSPQLR